MKWRIFLQMNPLYLSSETPGGCSSPQTVQGEIILWYFKKLCEDMCYVYCIVTLKGMNKVTFLIQCTLHNQKSHVACLELQARGLRLTGVVDMVQAFSIVVSFG